MPRQQTQALWLVLALVGLAIVVVHGAGWFHLTTFRERLETELGARLLTVTRLVATGFDAVDLDEDSFSLPTWRDRLEEARRRNGLASLTLLDADMRVIASTAETLVPGERAVAMEMDGREILSAWEGKAAVSPTLRVAEYMLKTAYAPVADDDGVVRAVLAAEGDHAFMRLVSDFEEQLLRAAAVALVALLLSGGVATVALRKLMRTREQALAADKLATVGRLAAGVTHEIRNPLSTISTTCQLLAKRLARSSDGKEGEETVRLMGYVVEEVERLDGILERFVHFSRPGEARMERVDPAESLARFRDLVARSVERRGTELHVAPVTGQGAMRADPRRLHQVLLNCVLNAAEAQEGREAASIRIAVERLGDGDAGSWRIRIDDDGPGFDAALGDEVLEAFVSTKTTGTGLGLAVVRDVLHEHGGELRLGRSDSGGGRVELFFPPWTEEVEP